MYDAAKILQHISSVRGIRVLIVGDIMLDRFVYSSAGRVSPEAPVLVLKFQRETMMPGGAANVARNVCEFGASVELIGLVGIDGARDDLRALIDAYENWHLNALESRGRPTTTKTRFIADRQQITRLDVEEARAADPDEEAALIVAMRKGVDRADLVILSDYAKGVLTTKVVRETIDAARRHGIPVIVDPKTSDFRRYDGASLITPNASELARAVGRPCVDDEAVVAGAAELLDATMIDAILVTRGDKGMTLVARGVAPLHLPTEARQVFDVSGAGDTVAAVLAVLLAERLPLPDAAYGANLAAGLVVEKLGTATVSRDELIAEIRRRHEKDMDQKILSLEAASELRRAWAKAGETVVFTNGVFDLLHPGHIALLRSAKSAGRRLIVGLNSDASVRRLKGPTRPVQNEDSRALVLSALDCVDSIVVFGDDTPQTLIAALRPDILVKGADYRPDQVVGREIVESYGGKLVLVDLQPNHSTTATIARMRGRK